MKKFITTLVFALMISCCLYAQDGKPVTATTKEFMQINTVESVLAGGLGRSRLIVTNPDGSQTDTDLENLFSMTGINFKNIKENENKLVKLLKKYTDEGWKLEHVTPLTLSQNDTGSGGIFMTRYLLSKEAAPKEKA
ncbi:hypothetical protein LZZ85_26090 [Terrimonas sp. NA20]|uniref:Uncharacterized protein n=1 Tax=Terrimonas ginsenosidimutans TaxID=2908004 RepID=A0ABS9KZQ1_9BACT|nr:hypothetical protein [Terrimonas ginsenosidimutans]MCG2617798.1 hypothetical protein [Terrimonas ginsenosidimutans]